MHYRYVLYEYVFENKLQETYPNPITIYYLLHIMCRLTPKCYYTYRPYSHIDYRRWFVWYTYKLKHACVWLMVYNVHEVGPLKNVSLFWKLIVVN